jgi:hypothetical protein
MTAQVTMLNLIYTNAPSLILTNAPLSLSINADALNAPGSGKNVATSTNLNQWFAFPNSSTPPTTTSFNPVMSIATNHPAQMAFFDDIFVQFYNESSINYLGGDNFPILLAQWGYVALVAQSLGKKVPKINIGLAKGVIQGNTAHPSVASAQGPTPPFEGEPGPPYQYFYPQYQTASPPNPSDTAPVGNTYPYIGVTQDALNLSNAITQANTLLKASGLPNASTLIVSDWCSGAGFWAGGPATAAAKLIFGQVTNLPQGIATVWSDAQYPAPDPQWAGNVPIVV